MLIRIEKEPIECDIRSLLLEAGAAENEEFVFFCTDETESARSCSCDSADSVLRRIKGRPGITPESSGRFAWILYDKTAETVCFGTDACGLGKLFYLKTEDRLILSDRISDLVEAADRRFSIDFTAWAEFLCFSSILGDRTFFSEIRTVFPDAYIRVTLDDWSAEVVPGFSFREISEDESIEYDDAVEKCCCLLRQAVERSVPNDGCGIVLPLSGGYDSRCLAGLVCTGIGAKNVSAVRFGLDNGSRGDELCAEQTAAFLGIDRQVYQMEEDDFFREIETYPESVDYETGMFVDFSAFLTRISSFYPKGTLWLDGYGGNDLLCIPRPGQISEEPGTDRFYEAFFRKNISRRLERCADPRNRAELYYLAKRGLCEELKRCGDDITAFYLYNRNARNMSYALTLESEWFHVAAPFMDWDFTSYALSLPKSICRKQDFFRDVLNRIHPGLGDLPDANDPDASYPRKTVIVDTPQWRSFMKEQLGDYWENIGGIYDPAFVWQAMDALSGSGADLQSVFFPFWMYRQWRERYTTKIEKCSLGRFFDSQRDAKEFTEACVRCEAVPYVEISERKKTEALWKEYVARNPRRSRNSMKMLFTMDVEGFCGEPRYIRHTHCLRDNSDQTAALQRLLLGGFSSDRCVLKELSDYSGIPFTFFIEPFSDAFSAPEALQEVFELCDSGENEAALHCHPFALRRELLQELGIPWNGYMSPEGLSRIVAYEMALYGQALNGRRPTSFRSGSLILYPEHFSALRSCGICVDSSGFLGNPNDFSGYGDQILNEPLTVEQGIYEIPVTTFYDMQSRGAKRKLDFNSVDYSRKLECVARNYSAGTKAVAMLMHSWSFSDYSMTDGRYGKLLDKAHGAVSQAALDELKFLAEFMADLGSAEFTTCKGLYCDEAQSYAVDGSGEADEAQPYAVDVSGEAIDFPVYPLPPTYGQLRLESPDGFLDLSQAAVTSSKAGCPGMIWEKDALVLKLPNEKQPLRGDWAMAALSLETEKNTAYRLSVELDCPYYKEKYRGRNTIRFGVYLDGKCLYENFVTEPNRNELVRRSFLAEAEKSILAVKVECLADEKPWNWGNAAKLFIRQVHLCRQIG